MSAYIAACADHATDQGLGHVCTHLAAGCVPFCLEQTGGMVMCVKVSYDDAGRPHWAPEQDGRYAWITRDDEGDGFMVGWYSEPGDADDWDVHPVEDLPELLERWAGR